MYRSREHYIIMLGVALIEIRAEHQVPERVWALSNLFHNTTAWLSRTEWSEEVSDNTWSDLLVQAKRSKSEAYLESLDKYATKKLES